MLKSLFKALGVMSLAMGTLAQANTIQTIEQYNELLPYWGVSWAPGSGNINGYHPTFYTGFAPRIQNPDQIHIRTSRGNQTRVSTIISDLTLKDYLYDLKARYNFYKLASSKGSKGKAIVNPISKAAPQLDSYYQILESPQYGILEFLNQNHSEEETYSKSLQVLKQLNPGRVFDININLKSAFFTWQEFVLQYKLNPSNSADQIKLINALVWGRINYTKSPSAQVTEALNQAVALAKSSPAEPAFLQAAFELFQLTTEGKYNFKVLKDNSWAPAIDCENINFGQCQLSYTEFTAVYPTGSLKSFTNDNYGNKITQFATPGLWNFIDSGSRDDVDNIRNEPYYGWAPKMDFEEIGNGFHNPAVRFYNVSSRFKNQLSIPDSHNTLWAVKRGGVSHGCLRLPLGHLWELRHILPVQNELVKDVYFFGNLPQDFDLYDVEGNGQLNIIGVEYLISYDLQGASSLAKREGKDLEVGTSDKLDFYQRLYGKKNIFSVSGSNYIFYSPSTSFPSYLDYKRKKVNSRMQIEGQFTLFEQTYEKDKVQFYTPASTQGLDGGKHASSLGKRIVRLMGRVRGCAPSSDKEACGENQFQREARSLYKEVQNITGRKYE